MTNNSQQYGRGLNSLRVRFTILIVACVMLSSILITQLYQKDAQAYTADNLLWAGLATLLLSTLAGLITYMMTGKLTRPIENLRSSTLAIANGDYNAAVQVECNCEVGGLADSFRAMVNRLNANVSRIQTLAYEDGVTGLPNRTMLHEALQRMQTRSGALFFIDLDNFKQVNDLHGHQVGDQLLREVAVRLQIGGLALEPANLSDCLMKLAGEGPEDDHCRMLFRFAGDEFIALVGGKASREELADIGYSIVRCLAEPFVIEGHTLTIGCSLGIAIMGEDTCEAEELIKLADLAMYEAKAMGKGNFCFFNEAMRTASIERAKLEADLVLAFQRREFQLHYQPKFAASNGEFAGVEALVRWCHPTRGLLFPGQFLFLAEEKKMLEQLGYEVFRLAAVQWKSWKISGRDVQISVNVCPTQFLDPLYSLRMAGICREYGVDPRAFTLEITETAAMSGEAIVHEQLKALQTAGFKISIDDFGVGYSNIAKLYQLPFQDLKLDKTMIDDIATDTAARRVVEYTISMAHGLGHPVVAAGVEHRRQMEVLTALGCDFIQGYLLSKPVAPEVLEIYLPSPAEVAASETAA